MEPRTDSANSAGILTQPIHPYAIEVMKENDIDISHPLAKSLFTIPINYLTHFFTVCDQAQNACHLLCLRFPIATGTYQTQANIMALSENDMLCSNQLETKLMIEYER